MDEAKQPEPIESEPKESIASRIERRETEIALAMKEEAERHAAVIKSCEPCAYPKRPRLQRRSRPLKPGAQASGVHSQGVLAGDFVYYVVVWAG